MKKFSLAMVVAMFIFTNLGVSCFASNEVFNFNDQKQKLTVFMDDSTTPEKGYYNRFKVNGGLGYENSLGGKDANDYSQITYVDNLPKDVAENDGYFLPVGNTKFTETRTIEASLYMDGDYDAIHAILRPVGAYHDRVIKFEQNGNVTSNGSVVAQYQKRQWQHIAITTKVDGKADIWLNGTKIRSDYNLSSNFTYYGWIRFAMLAPKNSTIVTKDTRNMVLGVDDYKEYPGEFTPTADNTVAVSFAQNSGIVPLSSKIFLPNLITAEEFKTALTKNTNAVIYSDATLATKVTTGNISEGNVLVANSADGSTFKYYTLTYNSEVLILKNTNFNNGETVPVYDDAKYRTLATEDNLHGKSNNKAYVINAAVPANMEITAGRFGVDSQCSELNDGFWDNLSYEKPSLTLEFSFAYSGDTGAKILGCPRYYEVANPTKAARGYKEYLVITKDGVLKLPGKTKEVVINKNQWTRISMSINAQEMQYDLYVNGEKVVSKAWLDDKFTNTATHKYRGFNWISLAGNYLKVSDTDTTLRNGKLAIDDLKIYIGDFNQKPTSVANISTTLPMENDQYIYVTGATEIADLVPQIDSGNATIRMYTNDTYTQIPQIIEKGNILVVVSEDESVMKYYKILYSSINVDGTINLYVNDKLDNILPTTGKISAKISANAPTVMQTKGTLILVIYENNKLKEIITDEKTLSGKTDFTVLYDLKSNKNITAKAMFLDALGTLKPYTESKQYIVIE